MSAPKVIGIVDAYSTGNKLRNRFSSHGYDVFHIQSSKYVPSILKKSFIKSEFKKNIIYNGCMKDLVSEVSNLHPMFILAGSETGVEVADKLANDLKLKYRNEFASSEARRNKFNMLESVRSKNLNVISQVCSNNLNEIFKWSKNYSKWPIVLKPACSSSSDGFSICHNEYEVAEAFGRIHDKENILGIKNENVICQEYLVGTQFVVNTVSYDSSHFVTDVWKMNVRHTTEISTIIDSMSLVKYGDHNSREIVDYIFKVLDALGIKYGAAHSEIMLTSEGIFLIEVNSRLMGGNIDNCFRIALNGYDQIDALVDSVVNPKNLNLHLKNFYNVTSHLSEIDFVFYKSGFLTKFIKEYEIRSMDSFHCFTRVPTVGSFVNKTSDTTNSAGLLYLLHKDAAVVEGDLKQILDWQKNDQLFQINS